MKLKLEIELDNDAFAEDPDLEVWDILQKASQKVLNKGVPVDGKYNLMDSNGNTVGFMTAEE